MLLCVGNEFAPDAAFKHRTGLDGKVYQASSCAKTRPQPMALCPTSELPISSSLGRPTAVHGLQPSRGAARLQCPEVPHVGSKDSIALLVCAVTTPSIMTSTTGPSLPFHFGFFFKDSTIDDSIYTDMTARYWPSPHASHAPALTLQNTQ
jgi:hypothetical protein